MCDAGAELAEREEFEPPGGVATATGKPAAALANGDLSKTNIYTSELILYLTSPNPEYFPAFVSKP